MNWKKNTAIFMISQAISIFGSALVQYSIMWHITLTTKSGVFATLAIICGFLPTLLAAPFGGVWADRYNRKKIIIIADGCIALVTLALALVTMAGNDSVWLLLAAMALRGLGGAFQSPSVRALLPDIVPEDQLTRVNGLDSSMHSVITLASPMLAGALLSFTGIEMIFFIDVVTAALAIAVMLLFFRLPEKKRERAAAAQPKGYFDDLKEGLRYIGATPFLKSFLLYFALINVLFAPVNFLTPLHVARAFGDEVWRLSAIEVAFSAGMLAGGLAIAAWGGLNNRVRTMALAGAILSLGSIALGMPIPFAAYVAFMVICGLTIPALNTSAIVMLQTQVDERYMGRVFSVMNMLGGAVMPLAMLVFGPLSDVIAIEWLLVFGGVALLIVIALMLRSRPLIKAGKVAAAAE